MANRRFTTVHDLAALRVHPDGSRVAINGKDRSKRVVRDQRGNYVSQDAAGPLGIKKRRAAVDDAEEEETGEVFDLTGVGELNEDGGGVDKGKRKAGQDEPLRSAPAKKRRRFLQDLTFLDPRPSAANFAAGPSTHSDAIPEEEASGEDLTSVNSIPNPSSVSIAHTPLTTAADLSF